jgi:predicted nucleic acid-binding protein
MRALPGHQFWPDDISLVDSETDSAKMLTSAQVTDTYLLALAKAHGGQLATFDRKLSIAAVKGGKSVLHLITGQ